MDSLSPQKRSANMSRIHSKDMKPEMIVRRLIFAMGYRYRLHARDLPGKPDIIFRKNKKIIMVHGCFWHQHPSCREGHIPKTRQDYWIPKLQGNVLRDKENIEALTALGWDILIIWECETNDIPQLRDKLQQFLSTNNQS